MQYKKTCLLLMFFSLSMIFGLFNVRAQTDVLQAVDKTTQFLIFNWSTDNELKKMKAPQVLPLAAGSKVYGACGERVRGIEVSGSAYCGSTNTVYLVPEELLDFYKAFGPSAVAYVVAHEFGHAIQTALNINLKGPARELQADCLAGMIFKKGSKELEITRNNVISMAQTAYAIGSDSHGSGAARSYALLSGMGVFKASCSNLVMQKLAAGQINDPELAMLNQQRSGSNKTNINGSPYPKTLKTALGL